MKLANSTYTLNSEVLHDVFTMRLNKEDRYNGATLVLASLLFWTIFALFFFHLAHVPQPWKAIVVVGFALYSWGILWGLFLFSGLRKPNWKRKRWQIREQLLFDDMEYHNAPFEFTALHSAQFQKSYKILFHVSLFFYVMFPLVLMVRPEIILFDVIPGIIPVLPDIHAFPARYILVKNIFYDDRMEMIFHNGSQVISYSAVQDIYTHKRYPCLALISTGEKRKYAIIKTDALEGASWEEIKERIAEASGNVSLKKELVKLKDDLRARRK